MTDENEGKFQLLVEGGQRRYQDIGRMGTTCEIMCQHEITLLFT